MRHRLQTDSSLGGKETTMNVIATKVQHSSGLTRHLRPVLMHVTLSKTQKFFNAVPSLFNAVPYYLIGDLQCTLHYLMQQIMQCALSNAVYII